MKEVPVSVGRRALFQRVISFAGLPEFPVGDITLAIGIVSNCDDCSICF